MAKNQEAERTTSDEELLLAYEARALEAEAKLAAMQAELEELRPRAAADPWHDKDGRVVYYSPYNGYAIHNPFTGKQLEFEPYPGGGGSEFRTKDPAYIKWLDRCTGNDPDDPNARKEGLLRLTPMPPTEDAEPKSEPAKAKRK